VQLNDPHSPAFAEPPRSSPSTPHETAYRSQKPPATFQNKSHECVPAYFHHYIFDERQQKLSVGLNFNFTV